MPYKYFGRTSTHVGKTVWEIVGNLKNFGVGRILVRSTTEKYPEPSFIKIIKVETLPEPKNPSPDNLRKVKITVEKTFRGVKLPHFVTLESVTYKSDYKLLAKCEEAEYCKITKQTEKEIKILPRTMEVPPLLKKLLMREMKMNGEEVVEPLIPVVYNSHIVKNKKPNYRIAEEGEQPNVEITLGVGKPLAPRLYKGIDL